MATTGNFEPFQYFNLETNFLKNDDPFQKTGVMFLVESLKIENVTFPNKNDLSRTNVNTNRMGNTN